jgi:hypothetical protein
VSLINEALKRAEAEKLGRSLSGEVLPPPPPIAEDPEVSPKKRPRPRMKLLLPILVCAAVAGGGFAAFRKLSGRGQATPQPAAASPVKVAPSVPVQPVTPRKAVKVSPETELAIARTIEALRYYTPPPRPDAAELPATAPAQPQTTPASPAVAATTQKAETASAPALKPKPATVIDESKYKLTGILRNADGGAAVINGSVVQVGQSVGGAKVVDIGRFSVELEVDGRRFTIRM